MSNAELEKTIEIFKTLSLEEQAVVAMYIDDGILVTEYGERLKHLRAKEQHMMSVASEDREWMH